MRYLRVELDQPEWMRHPMQEFLAMSENMQREELIAWNHSRQDVQFALFYVVGDQDPYRNRIDQVDPIRRYELTTVDESSFYVYVCQEYTEADETFLRGFAELDLVVIPPLVWDSDGLLRMTIVGPSEGLTAVVTSLRDTAEIGVDVIEISEFDRRHGTVTAGLTDRQFDTLETATRLGYFEVPRESSLAAVADELGVAESTVSELLRRAESNVMSRLLALGPGQSG
jgi:predicted DNA binding protein